MNNQDIKKQIIHTKFGQYTSESKTKLKKSLLQTPIEINESYKYIATNLMLNEGWTFKKATDLVEGFKTVKDTRQHPSNEFERLLKFPSEESFKELGNYLSMAGKSIKICMYTFTHRTLMGKLKEAKQRGVDVYLITDKESLSTIYIHEMAAMGIKGTHHNLSSHSKMHNKFGIIDDYILLNGSLNWTVKGVKQNHENVMVTGSKLFISQFNQTFESIWADYDHNLLSQEESAKKVEKEMSIIVKKRDLKESTKMLEKLSTKVAKIKHKIIENNKIGYNQGDSKVEDMYASQELTQLYNKVSGMCRELTIKKSIQLRELEKEH